MTASNKDPDLGGLERSFTELRERLHGYLRNRLSDPTLADDLLHDVFAKALSSLQSGRPIDNLGGWLFAITRSTLADFYRRRKEPMAELDESLASDDDVDERMHQSLATCLRPLIDRLPDIYRTTLIATDLEGQSMHSLAAAQHRSVSAIKSRAARGRAMVRAELLACCTVEMKDGWVADYHPRSPIDGNDPCC